MNFAYTGKAQSVTLEPGKYVLECWGAQGGYRSNSSYGGKGGYSTGTLTLTQKTTIYIYVGGSGNSVTSASNSIYPGGFNGGGYRYNYKGGGGATDIRIGSASLYARVIVAGGGGGSGYVYTSSSASNYPQGCLLNSSYYLSDASNLSGNESFKSPSGSTETGHSDNGYCRITCYIKKKTLHCKMNNEIKKAAPVFMKMNNKIYDAGANAVMDFAYTGTAQAISLPRGQYIIECWGAQGGSYSSYYGGAGGYSVGTITLTKNSTDLYIYVGGQPEATTSTGETPGGFNGGGKGCSRTYNYSSYGQGGGGATDVRIGKNDLYARVIVAGGGGGSSSENSLTTKYGGGTTGGSSASGYGATQTAAGTNGSFGQGGSATTSGTNYNYGSGGGGGGWYGGGACSNYSDSTNYQGYNGGGSGYVYTSATAANYPSGNYVNSSYYLTNAQTIAGNQSFKSPDGTNETGHTGNGFCRITRKSGKIFVKQNGSWIKV